MSGKNREADSIYQQYMYSYPHKTAYRTLPDLDIRDYLSRLVGVENSLYFHIPFCEANGYIQNVIWMPWRSSLGSIRWRMPFFMM